MGLRVIQLVPNTPACSLDRYGLFDCFFVAGMRRRQFFNVQDVNAEIADFAQTQSSELWDCFAHPSENVFNGMQRVAATDRLKEVS